MNASEYLQWYYLIYLLPGGTALLLLLLSAVGGGHHQRIGGHGHHALGGHHGGAHHPVGDHPHGRASRPAGQAAARPPVSRQALAFFGVGRVPATLVGGSLLLGWGLIGFWATRLLEPALHVPALFGLPALGLAVLGALATMRLTSALWTRLLPAEETFVTGTVDLCGLTGKAVYPVDQMRGRVHVYDAYGTLHDVSARLAAGQQAVARDRRVLVTDYDAAHDFVVVEELP